MRDFYGEEVATQRLCQLCWQCLSTAYVCLENNSASLRCRSDSRWQTAHWLRTTNSWSRERRRDRERFSASIERSGVVIQIKQEPGSSYKPLITLPSVNTLHCQERGETAIFVQAQNNSTLGSSNRTIEQHFGTTRTHGMPEPASYFRVSARQNYLLTLQFKSLNT